MRGIGGEKQARRNRQHTRFYVMRDLGYPLAGLQLLKIAIVIPDSDYPSSFPQLPELRRDLVAHLPNIAERIAVDWEYLRHFEGTCCGRTIMHLPKARHLDSCRVASTCDREVWSRFA